MAGIDVLTTVLFTASIKKDNATINEIIRGDELFIFNIEGSV
jgi:hypothetical protein